MASSGVPPSSPSPSIAIRQRAETQSHYASTLTECLTKPMLARGSMFGSRPNPSREKPWWGV
jgi:hypothetical protein